MGHHQMGVHWPQAILQLPVMLIQAVPHWSEEAVPERAEQNGHLTHPFTNSGVARLTMVLTSRAKFSGQQAWELHPPLLVIALPPESKARSYLCASCVI